MDSLNDTGQHDTRGSAAEVFRVFLGLGLTSFGGPIAHLGYFHRALVVRRRWIDEGGYADLVALCQFLPGPASSQLGFALGVLRANGLLGGLAAWTAFTLPSAVILLGCAFALGRVSGAEVIAAIHGLELVAVAVVAQAVCTMARSLAPDVQRAALALGAGLLSFAIAHGAGQIIAIAMGAAIGACLCGDDAGPVAGRVVFPVSRSRGALALGLFAALLLLPRLPGAATGGALLFSTFYRVGALVFGGGHVVLPLLSAAVVTPGWVDAQAFVSGYGLAQVVPGPLFSFAAYLGAVVHMQPSGIEGAGIALVAIFLPGLLLVYGMLPYRHAIGRHRIARAAMRGANAAVVGVLAAALYDPLWKSAILSATDVAIAIAGFIALAVWKQPLWLVAASMVAATLFAGLPALTS